MVAVALSHPEDGKYKVKENVFGEFDDLNSENGISILFEFLDKHFHSDELNNSLNKFEDFENYKRGHR